MDYRHTAAALVETLAKAIGVNASRFRESGVLAFRYKKQFAVTVEHPENRQELFLIVRVADWPLNETARLAQSLLAAQFLHQETRGATFGLDRLENALYLFYSLNLDTLEWTELETSFLTLLELAQDWNHRIETSLDTPADKGDTPALSDRV